ncbi:MAG: transcription repressor NadR [Acidaminococcus sp.]|jgi:transcriptional regulator of NAD metabolism|nr:transcription repressor NadR [Acidaminococcus sp.]MCI2100564.1 transcription repressor NadR [Acidaminococcus sp.]MCI2114891.1 transcription repressor NadR [Acidaminococcus sp.]MCI2116987.1 transcription repressor NadR [Acidaminococcus sp.]
MNGSEGSKRREKIKEKLKETKKPISGSELARRLHVSRQVIVQDIALLRASDEPILSTPRGYLIKAEDERRVRRFKVHHTFEQMETELNIFVDAGAKVRNVIVEHPVYGVLEGKLNLSSRRDVRQFMKKIAAHPEASLMNMADGVHYHTVEAPSMDALDEIRDNLEAAGILFKA